jgi:hypothetical protein
MEGLGCSLRMARIFNARRQHGAARMSRSQQTACIVLTTLAFATCRSQALLQRRAPAHWPLARARCAACPEEQDLARMSTATTRERAPAQDSASPFFGGAQTAPCCKPDAALTAEKAKLSAPKTASCATRSWTRANRCTRHRLHARRDAVMLVHE